MKRPVRSNFPRALRAVRKARGMAQEQFDQVSSRTYVSSLERGIKSPTLSKIDVLANAMNVHPLTLLTLSYCSNGSAADVKSVIGRVEQEVRALGLTTLD